MRTGKEEPQNLRLLFVNCIEGDVDWNEGIDLSGISLEVANSTKEFAAKLLAKEIDCAIALIDPGDSDCLKMLDYVMVVANEQKVPLAGMSRFNPLWIENLMTQLGFEKHFRKFPERADIANFISESEQDPSLEKMS